MEGQALIRLEQTMKRLMGMGFSELERCGPGFATVYLVGGFVRDSIMLRESKDIDVMVAGMPIEQIANILSEWGKVDLVGKSFGVLKFTRDAETIDVAVPRRDSHVEGGGHRDVGVDTDNVGLLDDLKRRDFTMNAMAYSSDGILVDPYGGEKDIYDRVIRCVDDDAFAADPLRMLRGAVFAARFDFEMAMETVKLIRDHSRHISRMSGERLREEMAKAWRENGNARLLTWWLDYTWLYSGMFGLKPKYDVVPGIKNPTLADFFYEVLKWTPDPAMAYFETLKGDVVTANEIRYMWTALAGIPAGEAKRRQALAFSLRKAPGLIHSILLAEAYPKEMRDFRASAFPYDRQHLPVDGNQLMQLGVPQKELGKVFDSLLANIQAGLVKYDKRSILKYVSKVADDTWNK